MAKGYIGTVTTVALAATAACVLAVVGTSPVSLGAFGVTAWFVGLLVALSCWGSLAAYLLRRRLGPTHQDSHLVAESWRRGLMAGGYLTVLAALSSLGQLNLHDALLLALLLVLVEFYMVARA